MDITLTCTYDDNPQATLIAALSILGTTLPVEVLQKDDPVQPHAIGENTSGYLKRK
jgi:hypothetical protein